MYACISFRPQSLQVSRPSTESFYGKLGDEAVHEFVLASTCYVFLPHLTHYEPSLSSLSDVLGALSEKRQHIPYRNSTPLSSL